MQSEGGRRPAGKLDYYDENFGHSVRMDPQAMLHAGQKLRLCAISVHDSYKARYDSLKHKAAEILGADEKDAAEA